MDRKIFIPRVPARSPALARTVFKPNFDTVLLSPGTKLIVFQNGWAGDSPPETSSKRKFLAVALQTLFFLLGRESFYCWAAKDFQLLGCKSFLFLMRCKCFFYCWVAKVFQISGCEIFWTVGLQKFSTVGLWLNSRYGWAVSGPLHSLQIHRLMIRLLPGIHLVKPQLWSPKKERKSFAFWSDWCWELKRSAKTVQMSPPINIRI